MTGLSRSRSIASHVGRFSAIAQDHSAAIGWRPVLGAEGERETEFEREAHRAIGRYVVEFSLLMAYMRTLITERLNPDPTILGDLVLGEAMPAQIASAFFGTCRELADLDQSEQKVASRLRARVLAEIERRNDIAHGDWFIDAGRSLDAVYLIRIRPMRKEGATKTIDVTTELLDQWSDSLVALRALVTEFGYICTGADPYNREGIHVGDILVMQSGEVVRAGQRADEISNYGV